MTLLLTLDDGSVQRALANAVEPARAAAVAEAGAPSVGEHVGVDREDAVSATHRFEAKVPGYRGWHWSVTVATVGEDEPVTISEVVLRPGPDALVAPAWVPWDRRVRAGDLGVGDIFPTDSDDPRLAPAYLASDDPAIEETAVDAGLGRVHVLSRHGRLDAAERWRDGEFGPRSDMARSAPGVCGTCGFFMPLAGSLRAAFGVCGNEISPGDGHVVNVEYGCGAHSETEIEASSSIPVAELVYDDSLLDMEPLPDEPAAEVPAAEASAAEATAAEASAAEVPVAVGAGTNQESEAASAQPGETASAEPTVGEPEPASASTAGTHEPEASSSPTAEERKVEAPSGPSVEEYKVEAPSADVEVDHLADVAGDREAEAASAPVEETSSLGTSPGAAVEETSELGTSSAPAEGAAEPEVSSVPAAQGVGAEDTSVSAVQGVDKEGASVQVGQAVESEGPPLRLNGVPRRRRPLFQSGRVSSRRCPPF